MLHETESATVKDPDLKQNPSTPTCLFSNTPVKLSQDSHLILPSLVKRMLPLQSPELCDKNRPSTKPSCRVTMGASLPAAFSVDSVSAQAKKINSVSDVKLATVPTSNGKSCSSTASHSVPQRKDLSKDFDSCDRRDPSFARPNSGIQHCSASAKDSKKVRQHSQIPSPSNKFPQGVSSCPLHKRHRKQSDQNGSAKKKRLRSSSTGHISPISETSVSSKDSKFSCGRHLAEDCLQPQYGVKQMLSCSFAHSCIRITDKMETLITEREVLKEKHGQKFKVEDSSAKFPKSTLERRPDERTKPTHPKTLTANQRKSSHKHKPLKYEDKLLKPDLVLKREKPARVEVIKADATYVKPSSANQKTSSEHNGTESLSNKSKDKSTSTPTTKTSTPKPLNFLNSIPYVLLSDIRNKVSAEVNGHNIDSSSMKVNVGKNDKEHKFKVSNSGHGDFQTNKDEPPVHSLLDVFKDKSSAKEQKSVSDQDSIDLDLSMDVYSIHSSESSDNEPLITLDEIMRGPIQPVSIPEEVAGPKSPGLESSQQSVEAWGPANTTLYLNNLDQMLKEIHINKKAKDTETELLTECAAGQLKIAEYEETKENQEGNMTAEQREFLQSYSLVTCKLYDVPPGEHVFTVEKFGRLFDQDTLQLPRHTLKPKGIHQKIFVWSNAAQLRLHLNTGLLQEAYNSQCPCPTRVTLYLFKMMSVHTERMVSDNAFRELCGLACTAAHQIVHYGNQQFKVWVPSLAEVTLVLLNMGVDFVTLYPFENLQPQFTEGDLLDLICTEASSCTTEQKLFPLHNCDNVFKYLAFSLGLCPHVYSDTELLLLLTVVSRIGLDSHYNLQSKVELYALQYKILSNFREWDLMLPRICLALTDLTDDHHNMCSLVQLLPDGTRGRELVQHLSMSMISKLLDGACTYRVTEKEFQLASLCPYLLKMQPSRILKRKLESARNRGIEADDHNYLDQEAYYLCYSLLTLMNEVSNFQHFPSQQKKQQQILRNDLERHIKCDIRENKKCLYRSRVKDLVARISTKWQMHCRSSKPLNDKLFDYWLPMAMDNQMSSTAKQADIDGEEELTTGEEEQKEESDSEDEKNKVDAQQELMHDRRSNGAQSCVAGDCPAT